MLTFTLILLLYQIPDTLPDMSELQRHRGLYCFQSKSIAADTHDSFVTDCTKKSSASIQARRNTIGLRPNCVSDPANLFFVKIVCVSHRRYQPLNVTQYLKQKRKCPFQEIKLQIIDNLVLYRVVRGIPNKDQEDPIGTPYTVSLFCIKNSFPA